MTYCIAMKLDEGLVCLSDTRTNAGVDDVARYRKSFTWEGEDRAVVLMSAGNLSITQGVISRLDRAVEAQRRGDEVQDDLGVAGPGETVLSVPSLFRLAQVVGLSMRELVDRHRAPMEKDGAAAGASLILGGQVAGEPMRLFLIYSAGNFIEIGEDTPFVQIGEAKYGKPIITRTVTSATPLSDAVKVALVSMDSSVRSNLSVGLPLDLCVIRTDALRLAVRRRIEEDDPAYGAIADGWSDAIKRAFATLPSVDEFLK